MRRRYSEESLTCARINARISGLDNCPPYGLLGRLCVFASFPSSLLEPATTPASGLPFGLVGLLFFFASKRSLEPEGVRYCTLRLLPLRYDPRTIQWRIRRAF